MYGQNQMEDLISVIIPVYNVAPYLPACADSVLAQTFRNLEIIFVDDGSTDGSGQICDEIAARDARVRVIHQANGGLSAARNRGMEAAGGAYFYFLDSDDAISPVTLAHLWTACVRTRADLAIGDFIRFSPRDLAGADAHAGRDGQEGDIHAGRDGQERGIHAGRDGQEGGAAAFGYPDDRRTFAARALDTQEALRRMLMNEGFGHQAWGKLFRRQLWDGFRFPEGLLYEDYAVIYDVCCRAGRVAAVTDALYYYRMQEGSIMHGRIGEKNLTLLDTSARVTAMLTERYPSLRGAAVRLQVVTYMRFLADMMATDYRLFPDQQKRIVETVKALRKEFLADPAVRKVDKRKLRALLVSRRAFYLLYKASDARKKRAEKM